MKFTGENTFSKYQSLDFVLEQVSSVPAFLPEDQGRVIIVTSGIETGLYVGGVSGWEKISQTIETKRFAYWGLVPTDTVVAYSTSGILAGERATAAGYIIGSYAELSTARTAGTVQVNVMIDGSPIADTSLNLLLNGSNPLFQHKGAAPAAGLAVAEDEVLGLQIISDGSLLPAVVHVHGELKVIYPT